MRLTKLTIFLFLTTILNCHEKSNLSYVIKIGVPRHSSFALVWIAREKNIFKELGLDVTLIDTEDAVSLYQNSMVDLICTTLVEPIQLNSEGTPTQVIYRFSYSSGNDILISRKGIKDIKDLKGKNISFDGVNSSSHIFIEEILNKHNIVEGEYRTTVLGTKEVYSHTESGKVDAGHTNTRYLYKIPKQNYNILAKSSELPDLLTDVLSGKAKFLAEHQSETVLLLKALLLAKEFIENHPDESIALLSKVFDQDKDNIKEELKSIRFLSREENIQSLRTTKSLETDSMLHKANTFLIKEDRRGALFLAAETIIQFLRTRGQLYKNPSLDNMIENKYLSDVHL